MHPSIPSIEGMEEGKGRRRVKIFREIEGTEGEGRREGRKAGRARRGREGEAVHEDRIRLVQR